jgi:hypothetical protein
LTRCILLGAGASHGYDDNLVPMQKPPLTNELFNKGIRLDLFSQQTYPILCEKLKCYIKKLNRPYEAAIKEIDVEEFMQWVGDELRKLSEDRIQTPESRFKEVETFRAALGEMWYFLFTILKHYSISYTPNFDNYQRLVLHFKNRHYTVISLNYDTLFELAIVSVGGSYDYESGKYPHVVPIAKVHGSINWFNQFGQGGIGLIIYRHLSGKELLPHISPLIFENKMNANPGIIVVPPNQLYKLSFNHILRSGTDYFEPVLLPPLGSYKDYEKISIYKKVWGFAEYLLSEASELVIIGTRLREQDLRLCEAIHSNLNEGTKIITVSKNKDLIKERLTKILRWNNEPSLESYETFTQFAKTL